MIGRDAPMTAIRARLAAAAGGRGSAVWITGEAGVGKTYLIEALADVAKDYRAIMLSARCHDESPPYWPFIQVAREYNARVASAASVTPIEWPTETAGADEQPPIEFGRFDSFVRALRAGSERTPIIVSIEDIHWADDQSLDLLQFVAREVASSHVLLVLSFRDAPPIGGTRGARLASAIHMSGAITIPLRPLSVDEVHSFLELTTGAEPAVAQVQRFHEKSGGNPLYLRELLKTEWGERVLESPSTAASLSTQMSEGLQSSIEGHLAGVSTACRDALTSAALLDETFDFAMLAAITHLTDAVLLDLLTEAVRARLVEKASGGTYRFLHPLVRTVLYKGVAGARRAAEHATIAGLLEAHWGTSADAHAPELSHHYVRALPYGDPRRALDLSLRAAELTATRGAHQKAASFYQGAIEALRHLRGEDERGILLFLSLARAWEKAKNHARAREAYLDAAVLAKAFHRADALAQAALGFLGAEGAKELGNALLNEANADLSKEEEASGKELREMVSKELRKH
jgi:predicted ATPase